MIDKYLERRYSYLKGVATNIVSSQKKWSNHKEEDSHDLLHHVIEDVIINEHKYDLRDESHLESIIVNKLRTQWHWGKIVKGSFWDVHKIKSDVQILNDEYNEEEVFAILITDAPSELETENISDYSREYLKRLQDEGFSDDHIEKLLAINISKQVLTYPELTMFRLYFIEGKTIREICKEYRVSSRYVIRVKKEMKTKIQLLCSKLLN